MFENERDEFLEREIFLLSWGASVQHNHVYTDSADPLKRAKFRSSIEKSTFSYVTGEYQSPVSHKRHVQIIEEIKENAESFYGDVLESRTHKVGTVQKQFNLLLKYFWCLGRIPMPPDCPVDRIVLQEAGLTNINWTELATVDQYIELIAALRRTAGDLPLSVWELRVWKRRTASQERNALY